MIQQREVTTVEIYDAIIVGLGPGGSATAYQLALKGHRVLALEKYIMPRQKPCGGCLSAKIRSIIDEDIESLAEDRITKVVLTFHGEGEINVVSSEPIAYMVSRDTFDHHMAKKAGNAGAEIHDNEAVTNIDVFEHSYLVHTTRGSYQCRFLVGADGVNGVVSRLLGYGPRRDIAVTLEGEVKVDRQSFEDMKGTVRLDIGAIPYGYGWIFPKENHWSVGVGSVKELSQHPKEFYATFLEEQGVEELVLQEKHRGFRIPLFGGSKSQLTQGRSLLVGDAAALVDPFLGEGIYYAIRSGQLAADTIHAALESDRPVLSDYQDLVTEEFFADFEAAQRVARFGYRFLRLAFTLFKLHPGSSKTFIEILRGNLSYVEYWNALKRDVKHGVFDFLALLKTPAYDVEATYDRVADQYDAWDFLWKQTLAKSAWNHVENIIENLVPKGGIVLDAGVGTGESLKTILRLAHPRSAVGIDVSSGMLNHARSKIADPRVELRKADMRRLPFPDGTFDAVISAWAIETLPDPKAAVQEMLRVIKDDGYVIYAFSSMPRFGISRLYSFMLEKFLGTSFDWRFLPIKERPYHSCPHSSLTTFGNELMTVVVLRKCCTVQDETTPCQLPEDLEVSEGA